tara:strand:- start:122 stop:349 length:228 start_codon:yes stop_codon:yes gene_type:complete
MGLLCWQKAFSQKAKEGLEARGQSAGRRDLPATPWLALLFGDDPDSVDDARYIAEYGQKDVDPEMQAYTYLQKYA